MLGIIPLPMTMASPFREDTLKLYLTAQKSHFKIYPDMDVQWGIIKVDTCHIVKQELMFCLPASDFF